MKTYSYKVEAQAYDGKRMVGISKTFTGEPRLAYNAAMVFAYEKAGKFSAVTPCFSVTIRGNNWRTASFVNPL